MAECESTSEPPTAEAGTKRKRPLLRRVGVVVGCLLAGAIINVLVAWGCAIWWPVHATFPMDPKYRSSNPEHWDTHLDLQTFLAVLPTRRGLVVEDHFCYAFEAMGHRGHRLVYLTVGDSDYSGLFLLTESGWPFRSMAASWEAVGLDMSWDDMTIRSGVRLPPSIRSTPRLPFRHLLPLEPMTVGFIANTILYGCVFAIGFASCLQLRAKRRQRRGLCPSCGYDLRGADHGKCPECGEAVKGEGTKARRHGGWRRDEENERRSEGVGDGHG